MWLPYFLSIYYVKEITLPKNSLSVSLKTSYSKSNKFSSNKYTCEEEDRDSPEYLSTVFLEMLDKNRASQEHFWIDIGKGLHHAFKGEERGLEKWIDFTEYADTFGAEDCKAKWYNLVDDKITIRTIAYYARVDSPQEYKRWHRAWSTNSLEKATSCTHADVAEAIYRLYWLDFACGNLSKNTMYHFRNHIWKKTDSGFDLRSIIGKEFLNALETFRADIAIQIKDSEDKNFKDSAEIMIQKVCKLISKLKNRPFKNSVYSECTERFYIERFEDILDTNPNLMGCTNGLIETLETKAVFRDGKPEDYVSKTTGVYYRKDMNESHPTYLKLLNWFNKVFTDRELCAHFGKMMGALLKGRNSDKIFPILTGAGDNSKSMIKKMIEAAFGDYVITFQLSTFTGARTGGPDPSVARSRYAHVAFLQEPDADVPIKSGVLKEFTGGDRFFARFLHSNGDSEISPMFVLFLICNDVPPMASDKALKNRTKILPFLSSFVRDAPKNPDDQFKERKFPLDPFFENGIPDLAPAFLYYCMKNYAIYRREGLSDPLIVRKYTGDYWEEHDYYGQFIKDHIEKAYKPLHPDDQAKGIQPQLDETAYITLTDLYSRFKDWFKENYQLKLPDRPSFKNQMEIRVTKCIQRNFYGIKFKISVADI
jgi:phage/plasmid-associated DNA primase